MSTIVLPEGIMSEAEWLGRWREAMTAFDRGEREQAVVAADALVTQYRAWFKEAHRLNPSVNTGTRGYDVRVEIPLTPPPRLLSKAFTQWFFERDEYGRVLGLRPEVEQILTRTEEARQKMPGAP